MKKININKNWDFYESNECTGFMLWQRPEPIKVDLPHDYIITKQRDSKATGGPANAYYPESEGVYKKNIIACQEWKDKTVLLDIDGAYMNAEIELNGEVLGLHPHGYTPFQVDITNTLDFDKDNLLKIITQSRQPSTRWYSGGGLYRSVDIWVGGKACIKPWDIFISTLGIDDNQASLQIMMDISNSYSNDIKGQLTGEIFDQDGKRVTSFIHQVSLKKDSVQRLEIQVNVNNPILWDIDNPYLYTCSITLESNGQVEDIVEEKLGIREISVSVDKGFTLNGKSINLKGGCLHHDNGLLGACAYPKAEERKIRKLKECGFNAVRISHNPPSLAMLEACDKLGMLLLDECFDCWRLGKMPLDYHLYFEDWWQRDIEYMVKRDRKHPCVISYSIGNEIAERDGKNNGALWAKRIADKIRSLDNTRFVMSGLTGVFEGLEPGNNFEANTASSSDRWAKLTEEYCQALDVVGYNYLNNRYEADHQRFPERIMVGSESHSFTTYDYWQGVEKYPYVIGDFIWAAVDYFGEVGVGKVYWQNDNEPKQFMQSYPWRTSWQSDLLITLDRRPQSYYREIMWGNSQDTYIYTTHPKHYNEEFFGFGWHWFDVYANWSFENEYFGRLVKVDAYGSGDEAEFILNGKSLGKRPYQKYIATMDIAYEPGKLEVISYKNNVEISRSCLETVGRAQEIKIIPEEHNFAIGEIYYLNVEIVDRNGNVLPMDQRRLELAYNGAIEILAFGNASPVSEDIIGDNSCHAFLGKAQLIIKALEAGEIKIGISSDDISGSVSFVVENNEE